MQEISNSISAILDNNIKALFMDLSCPVCRRWADGLTLGYETHFYCSKSKAGHREPVFSSSVFPTKLFLITEALFCSSELLTTFAKLL